MNWGIRGSWELGELRNCEVLGRHDGVRLESPGKFIVENCVFMGETGIAYHEYSPLSKQFSLVLVHNTLLTGRSVRLCVNYRPANDQERPADRFNRVESRGNLVGGPLSLTQITRNFAKLASREPVPPDEADRFLLNWVQWIEKDNWHLVPDGSSFLGHDLEGLRGGGRPHGKLTNLAAWEKFWSLPRDANLRAGPVRFQGGNLATRLMRSPAQVSPQDFRLADGSPGKGAGPDGKDPGANVDLVGPGEAYERWKKTPEYQQWFKTTGQLPDREKKPPQD